MMAASDTHLLPPEAFPFTVRCYGPEALEPYWQTTVARPEQQTDALYLPAAKAYGVERCARVTIDWPDGSQTIWDP